MFYKMLKPLLLMVALLPGLALASDAGMVAAQAGNEAEVVWQAIQQGAEGRTVSDSEFHAQLINPQDERLLPLRSNILAPGLALALFGMIAVFAAFIAVNGISKLHHGFSGKMVYRWSKADVAIHWLGAIPCLLLILTGLTLLAGRLIIEPYLGQQTFASMAAFAKPVHDYMAIPFMLGWLLMTVKWAKNQIPAKYDIAWFMVVGGYINFGPFKGKHPDAGFANAGEKLWFWTFAAFGALISATGVILLFPEYVEPSRNLSLLSLIIHGAAAIIICAFSIVHIFMATVMSEGGMECMVSGYCDENWAIQHHNVWFDEIKADGTLKYKE
ncbi:formate dehydrogenase gamma subunit [Ferrimonas balearica DSM 9799]|uniref:Formate dehydrogenase gamma subunit n=1 Tax=Ferrimonas balearica (strain DSM 9799 / CCM 4581 / KCTC 23876 / PAT) TaxID=550540 RepID=E1SNX3_FERBD|nr:formate dehydrogenase subunit gamma [Ferrimonas balearica]MBY6019239.1 formate dehydrogenase subunit gamma [Halomonas denitrificans]ADN77780.1 formate dehydrogenase gamma subunit [Ferrimonas balearica DSM 9799]MBW3140853.1 formate dehydrogenase subunit gamma [Ferrimonas balearica]MBW3165944.1 formate dehydrogenase subunit gamma [Ferrimonas balearica]MBY5981854.1 formate dehydrogenase subunit gamma [Ferrimonas balearica]